MIDDGTLIQTLGKVNTSRLLQMFNKDSGDSVKDKHERDTMYENMGVTVDDILADMGNAI